jgi:deazaflavin-dependent oxidoreductase (nitroreductase family)
MRIRRNALIKLSWQMHLKIYLWSKGRIGNVIRGLPILVLTTKGRKSGLTRQNALMYLPYGQDFVVIASNLGDEKHPAWWINLKAEPTASVQIKDAHYTVHAREAADEEREKLWQAIAEKNSDYEQYRTWTSRRIPVVILDRVERSAK